MFTSKIINFIRKAVYAWKYILRSEDIKPFSATVRIPTIYRAKYGMPKVIQRNNGGMK